MNTFTDIPSHSRLLLRRRSRRFDKRQPPGAARLPGACLTRSFASRAIAPSVSSMAASDEDLHEEQAQHVESANCLHPTRDVADEVED